MEVVVPSRSDGGGGAAASGVRAAREGLGVCVVTDVLEVTPRVRRVTLRGEGLREAVATGPDQRVKLSFPASHRFSGDAAEVALARRRRRTYTLLDLDPASGTATVDFVLHPAGVAAAWAAEAVPGDEVMLTAPVGGFEVPDDADEVVLVADETGLPALQAIAAGLAPSTKVRAFVEIADAGERQPIPSGADLEITWLERDGAPHGGPMTRLAADLAASVSPQVAVWIAGEAAAVRTLRNALITDAGVDRHRIDAVAYWTEGR